MSSKSIGIVLGKLKHNDSTQIIKMLSPEKGLISAVFRGGKSANKKGLQLFQPGNIVQVEVSNRGTMPIVKEVSIATTFSTITYDLEKSTQVLFMAELLANVITEQHEDLPLFNFVLKSILSLDTTDESNAINNAYLVFAIRLTTFFGIGPTNNYKTNFILDLETGLFVSDYKASIYQRQSSQVISNVLGTKFDKAASLKLNKEQRTNTMDMVMEYYKTQLPEMRELKSLQILKEVAS